MCLEFSPDIQNEYGDAMLPFIINAMSNSLLKVQYRAVACLVNFSREIINCDDEGEILNKYADKILNPLAALFEKAVQINS